MLHGLVVLAVVATASAVDECGGYASIARLPLMNISLTVCLSLGPHFPLTPPMRVLLGLRNAARARRGGLCVRCCAYEVSGRWC